ncbi:MAG: sugar phosphate isomerase/epimerase family protein [Myxococcota bacterium]
MTGETMVELCFNCMNRSAYLLGQEDPDLPGQIRAAGAAGFKWIGPDFFSIQRFCEDGGRVEDLAAQVEAAGLRTFELPTLMIGQDVNQVRRDVEAMLPAARILRPAFVQINVESNVDEGVLAETRRAAERFGEIGAELAIEYLPWLPEINRMSATRSMIDRIADPRVKLLVDTWHFFHSQDTWAELEALPLSEIAYVQFDDHPPLESEDLIAETVGRRVMPGEGVFALDRFCDVIRAKGFNGIVSCEILSEETRGMARLEFAERVYSSCAKYWN